MNRRDIYIGLIVILLIAGFVYWRNTTKSDLKVPEAEVASSSTENNIEEKFNIDIPDNVTKAELKDVSGGNGSAIATREPKNNNELIAVLADLPDPEKGTYYQGWISDGTTQLSLGRLQQAKGGWMVDYQSNKDISGYKKVVVSLQTKSTTAPEKNILEGSF